MTERLQKRRESSGLDLALPALQTRPGTADARAWPADHLVSEEDRPTTPKPSTFGHHFSQIPALPTQDKLTVSTPGDGSEREADAMSDEVMGMDQAEADTRRGPRTVPKASVVARAAGGGGQGDDGPGGGDVTAKVEPGLRSPGQPIDAAAQGFFEASFGHDFSRIRVHTDAEAALSAKAMSARAYTVGQDIVFGPGEYAPGTPGGRRLLAHELTHTVQQASGSGAVVQRQPTNASTMPPNSSSASTPPMTPAPAPAAPAAIKTIVYKGKTLHSDPVAGKKMLLEMIGADGYKATIAFLDDLSTLTSRDHDFNAAFKPEENEAANLCVNTTAGLRAGIVKDHDDLLDQFATKAKAHTHQILTESEKRINAEREKYGIPAPKFMHDKESGADLDVTPRTMANNDATKAMATAAGELVPPRRKVEALLKRFDACLQSNANNNAAPGMSTKSVIPGKEAEAQDLDGQIQEARREFNVLRAQKEREAPILATYGPEGESNTDSLENIARGTASQGLAVWRKNAVDELVPMVAEKLHNIEAVRAAIDSGRLNIWSNDTIVRGAKADQGFGTGSWQGKIIDEKVKEVHDDEFLINLLVGVLAIALGLVAIFATAGGAVAAVAAVGSGVLSTGQAINSLSNYTMAQAEAGTDFDKARVISQEDPSLAWLALDLIAAALDLKAAVNAFKVLGPAIRGAIAAGKTPEAMEKLGASLEKYPAAVKSKVLAHAGAALDAGKPALNEMEKVARAQYKALQDANRLGEIGNVTEEVFVKQMLSGAGTHIIISGEEGVRRTGLVTALMQPGNERIAAILKGDAKAIDTLIVEHGNWKQLLGMLEQGTPEMRQAGAKLFERRQSLLGQLEAKFNAKPVSGASSERVSDIDLSTYGADAGSDMIKAEEHMKSLYGPGWSEALRMNFYTEAGRLTLYEKVMPGLSKAEQAKLLGEITADAEKLNVAKMLAHAEGNPSRLAEVEAYAKKMGVDVKDPKIQELVPKLAGGGDVAARNKTLLEIDELTKKANAAVPGSPEHIDLVKQITSRQMEVNAMTAEAYIGPGAGRMTVSGVKVIGQEAYQAAMSNLEMIQHIMHECAGDVVTASREYEIYKYINRFAEAAENAGAKTQGLDYWKNFSGFASKTERQATSGAVHLGPRPNATVPKGGQPFLPDVNPNIGPVTDQFLQQQYEAWNAFSQEALGDLKKISQEQPSAWAGFNPPRPAAGVPPKP